MQAKSLLNLQNPGTARELDINNSMADELSVSSPVVQFQAWDNDVFSSEIHLQKRVWLHLTGLMNNQTTDAEQHADDAVSRIAAAIGEPARARILYCLVDGHARTSTELSVVADVSPSTTSVHLEKLKNAHLVNVLVQGKHRFYSLAGPDVARALEGLSVLAGSRRDKFVSNTPTRLRVARPCYDHMAGMALQRSGSSRSNPDRA